MVILYVKELGMRHTTLVHYFSKFSLDPEEFLCHGVHLQQSTSVHFVSVKAGGLFWMQHNLNVSSQTPQEVVVSNADNLERLACIAMTTQDKEGDNPKAYRSASEEFQ